MTAATHKPDSRKHERRPSRYEVLVYNEKIFSQLVDISEGGLAFAYEKSEGRINDIFLDLNILCNNNDIHIRDIRCKATSDVSLDSLDSRGTSAIRRQGVQFETLTETQRDQLLELMKKSTR